MRMNGEGEAACALDVDTVRGLAASSKVSMLEYRTSLFPP